MGRRVLAVAVVAVVAFVAVSVVTVVHVPVRARRVGVRRSRMPVTGMRVVVVPVTCMPVTRVAMIVVTVRSVAMGIVTMVVMPVIIVPADSYLQAMPLPSPNVCFFRDRSCPRSTPLKSLATSASI